MERSVLVATNQRIEDMVRKIYLATTNN